MATASKASASCGPSGRAILQTACPDLLVVPGSIRRKTTVALGNYEAPSGGSNCSVEIVWHTVVRAVRGLLEFRALRQLLLQSMRSSNHLVRAGDKSDAQIWALTLSLEAVDMEPWTLELTSSGGQKTMPSVFRRRPRNPLPDGNHSGAPFSSGPASESPSLTLDAHCIPR